MSDELILVDLADREIGYGEKLWVHQNDRLHRAFSVFIVKDGKMLIQRRNINKYHSGGLWANACCSHPRRGEELSEAVDRRLAEELGADDVAAEEIFHFVYRATYENGLTEYEYDHVFLAEYDGELNPDPDEIEAVKWVEIHELAQDVLENPGSYAAWFLIALPRLLEHMEGK